MLLTAARLAATIGDYTGRSGRRYAFKQLLQEKPHIGRVWLAMFASHFESFFLLEAKLLRSNNQNFVLKDIPKSIFEAYETCLRPHMKDTPNIRLPLDEIDGRRIFVYRYLTDELLTLVRKNISIKARKGILKSSLQGLVDLHDQDIVHLGQLPLLALKYELMIV